jgi:hypothetical protein
LASDRNFFVEYLLHFMRLNLARTVFFQSKAIFSSLRMVDEIVENIATNTSAAATNGMMPYPLGLLMPKTQTQQVHKYSSKNNDLLTIY